MQLGEHLTIGFIYGLAVGVLLYIFTFIAITGLILNDPNLNLNPTAWGILAFAFGLLLSIAMSLKKHSKGE